VATSAQLPSQVAHALLTTARHAFTDGMNVVAWVGAAVLVAAAAMTVALLRHAD
jgi:DHA2 family multidrug resistance protein-like MFS transporter